MTITYIKMRETTCQPIRIGRRSPLRQRASAQTTATIGGKTIAVNLQENARPPATALAQNHGHHLESRNRQKNQNMAVVAATSGSSIVAIVPWAIRLGESANSQAASAIARGPWLWRLHAAVSAIAANQIQRQPSRTTGKSTRWCTIGSSIHSRWPR